MIKKLLIANRGEIALRILHTARAMGIYVITIYSEEDKEAPHRLYGDESLPLGDGSLQETYLNGKKIVELALKAGADAIHPGYGLLSEKSFFAEMVESAGLIWVGPSSHLIALMGDKVASKHLMEKIGVPLIPGYHGSHQEPDFLLQEALKVGFPLLIKASAGGGGKGMRLVAEKEDFFEALESAKREAKNAFGDETVFLEKYLLDPRHIEFQVFSDKQENHVHLYERECSIQRRHQKIIEETPSVALNPLLRQKMGETAIQIIRHIGYIGAGTLEFMLDRDNQFYFLEMNTRLQVEHPITEAVTGADLVKWQIMVAQGEAIPLTQNEIKQRGHAIEVRICCEDPEKDFLPTVGRIVQISDTLPVGVRLDAGYREGNTLSINFDPMIAKVISWGEDRESARLKLIVALRDHLPFLGVKTNRAFLISLLEHHAFKKGETTTHFIEHFRDELKREELNSDEALILMALSLLNEERCSEYLEPSSLPHSAWSSLQGKWL